MTDFQKDMARIQELVGGAFTTTGGLVALASGGEMNDAKLQRTLEDTLRHFEDATLALRVLCETHSPGAGDYGKKALPGLDVTGEVDLLNHQWLHIQLNTLLPHCRYQSPIWLTDTIHRLLDGYQCGRGGLPFYRNGATLVIDEHSRITHRRIYDQDNKGWKAVSNALKGRVIPDDNQYALEVILTATDSTEKVTHITLMDRQDAGDFLSLRSGLYAGSNIYETL